MSGEGEHAMGFDVTAANIIFFVAAVTVGSVALGAYWKNADHIEEAQRSEHKRADELAHTNLTVTSASYNGGSNRFTVDIMNTGSTVVDVSAMQYLLDGSFVPDTSIVSVTITGSPGTDVFLPLETIEVILSSASSPSYFQVVTDNGALANWRS